jgi:tetratricopeptide (TPR) repeat protein
MTPKGTRLRRNGWVWCLLALVSARFVLAETAGQPETPEAVMRRAVSAEREGRTNEAVCAYERLLAYDTAYESVVTPRLISLYSGSGNAAQALAWAARAARRQPRPKAYLSGVYALLGQLTESELLLREAVLDEREPLQRAPLLWQLAEIQERQGKGEAALATLVQACAAATDERLRATAAQRLAALRSRLEAARPARPAASSQPMAEDTP